MILLLNIIINVVSTSVIEVLNFFAQLERMCLEAIKVIIIIMIIGSEAYGQDMEQNSNKLKVIEHQQFSPAYHDLTNDRISHYDIDVEATEKIKRMEKRIHDNNQDTVPSLAIDSINAEVKEVMEGSGANSKKSSFFLVTMNTGDKYEVEID